MRVLVLGYIPKELGGSYTTGIANVVLELCKCKREDVELMCFSSNVPKCRAKKIESFRTWGYTKNLLCYVKYVFIHPMKTMSSWNYYKKALQVNPVRHLFYQVNLHYCIQAFKPDIIHVLTSGLLPTAKKVVGNTIPCVVTFHGFHYQKPVNTQQDNVFIEAIMPLCEEVTALTHETKEDILKSFPYTYKHLEVIPNGCDTGKFYYSEESRVKVRAEFGISEETPTFITVGNINENKGQLRFVEYLHKSGLKNYKYFIIGKGEYEERIKSFIYRNNLVDKVFMLGYVSNTEIYKYYSASDVYAHTSQSEGQSLSELEAESTGLRIIVNESLKGTLAGDVSETQKYYILNFEQSNYMDFWKWVNMPTQKRKSTNIYDWNNVLSKYVNLFKEILSDNKID